MGGGGGRGWENWCISIHSKFGGSRRLLEVMVCQRPFVSLKILSRTLYFFAMPHPHQWQPRLADRPTLSNCLANIRLAVQLHVGPESCLDLSPWLPGLLRKEACPKQKPKIKLPHLPKVGQKSHVCSLQLPFKGQ